MWRVARGLSDLMMSKTYKAVRIDMKRFGNI
jgi:hypothetical protein